MYEIVVKTLQLQIIQIIRMKTQMIKKWEKEIGLKKVDAERGWFINPVGGVGTMPATKNKKWGCVSVPLGLPAELMAHVKYAIVWGV